MDKEHEQKIVYRVSIASIAVNLALVLIKALAGTVGHSKALISDAVHSASDVFSTVIVIIGYKLSRKQEDSSHPYGHERIECVAAVILATMLALTGALMGFDGVKDIYRGTYKTIETPGIFTIIAAIISIAAKEIMYWVTRHAAKKINSDALMADAWHHRSDALSSVGSLAGVILARNGFPIADPVAAIVICLFILKVSFDIYSDAFRKMVDHSCDNETVEKIRQEIKKENGVESIHSIKTRMFGAKIYVDVELYVDGRMTLTKAHEIAENVHDRIENTFPDVKHCMIHVEPIQQQAENMLEDISRQDTVSEDVRQQAAEILSNIKQHTGGAAAKTDRQTAKPVAANGNMQTADTLATKSNRQAADASAAKHGGQTADASAAKHGGQAAEVSTAKNDRQAAETAEEKPEHRFAVEIAETFITSSEEALRKHKKS